MLSQEEIDALLRGSSIHKTLNITLTPDEKDALGEIGNISMGTAATTLFALVGHKVTITTPRVSEASTRDLANYFNCPCVVVLIKYREGIEGFNLLILQDRDVKIITDLMMGGDGSNIPDELSDMHISAIAEAMNQMIGSACTSLSEMFHKKIDIHPPDAKLINFNTGDYELFHLKGDDPIAVISFNMNVEGIINSEIMQVIPIDFAKEMVSSLLSPNSAVSQPEPEITPKRRNETPKDNIDRKIAVNDKNDKIINEKNKQKEPVVVKTAKFESFDKINSAQKENMSRDIELLKDIPLEITVELGRTTKKISDILSFGPGTVIELDNLVGEPLDIIVNGRKIAKGEVVVVDENYGVKITKILSSKE